jgi:hypothetical protein
MQYVPTFDDYRVSFLPASASSTAAPTTAAPVAAPAVVANVAGGFRGLLDRLDNWLWRQRQAADERYLAQSQDVFDLERRIASLERSIGSRYF